MTASSKPSIGGEARIESTERSTLGTGTLPLRSILSEEQFRELSRVLQQMETDIVFELGKVRLM